MDFNISDKKLEQIVEKEIARYISERVERVMNNGKAYEFIHRLSDCIAVQIRDYFFG